ncbi:MAG: hypothetical protein M1833_001550 [Piccolia ochrophora]|nr:MAG: hypothetical protein M1833_001550 [Piccolia ochrophora]
MRLSHLSIPSTTSYFRASAIQDRLAARLLQSKSSQSVRPPPGPTVLTAEFLPVYTCGRRDVGRVSPSQEAHLRASGRASFAESPRGGQTTFHGPGQLVAYPILDLKAHGLTPRTYVRLLETTVIKTVGRYGLRGFTTENPGVWTSEERKIAAVGVHLRRNVSSHGIALNVNTDLWWFDRIVACGLEGKETTNFEREGVTGKSVKEVGEVFVEELAHGLAGVDGVEMVQENTS